MGDGEQKGDALAGTGRWLEEFRVHWRPLLAAFLGVGSALSLNTYILSVFAPYLIGEFGWTRAEWALLGIVQLAISFCLPVAGRLTDMFGVRRVAAVGALSFPAFLVAITMMDGSIETYFAIYLAQTVVCSVTTSTVYTRVVAETYRARRGLALGLASAGPPVIGALGAPLVSAFVAEQGWRAGYLAVAAFCFLMALITLALLSPQGQAAGRRTPEKKREGVYREIFAMPVFWLMLAAAFLVNTPFTVATSQLKLVVLEQGLGDATAAWLVTVFAVASLVGRLISGAALDYLSAPRIAAINFSLPVIGLLILASPLDSTLAVTIAMTLIGLSFGAEGDIMPYLVTNLFGIRVYSTVLGMLMAAMGGAMAAGNAMLAFALNSGGTYNHYFMAAAACSFAGAMILLLLGNPRFRSPFSEPATAP